MNKKGFTLVELVVVIAIIGALAAILIPTMMSYIRKAKLKGANSNAKIVFNTVNAVTSDMQCEGNDIDVQSCTAVVDCTAEPVRDSLEYFPASGYDIEWMTYDLHENEPEWNIRTEHEGMFTEMGIKIKALIARKKPGDDSVTWIEPKVLKRMAREAAEAESAAKAAQEGESNV